MAHRGSRRHVLEWIGQPSFIRELNELLEPLPISIQASDPYMPISKDKPEKARLESFGTMVVDNTHVWATL